MAARTPVYFDESTNDIIGMSSNQINNIVRRVTYLYGENPSIALNVVANNGSLDAMTDTRLRAGTGDTNASDYPAVTTGSAISETWDVIDESNTDATPPADTNNIAFPMYYDGSDLKAMTQQDFYDTFITPAIDLLAASDTDEATAAGTYTIRSFTPFGNHTQIGVVFEDTINDISKYTAAGIPEAVDQHLVETTYYLYRREYGTAPTIRAPLIATSSGHLKTVPLSTFDTQLTNALKYNLYNVTGNRLSYQIEDLDNYQYEPRGTLITNTRYNAHALEKYFGDADDYRAQYFVSGSTDDFNNYYLTLRRY